MGDLSGRAGGRLCVDKYRRKARCARKPANKRTPYSTHTNKETYMNAHTQAHIPCCRPMRCLQRCFEMNLAGLNLIRGDSLHEYVLLQLFGSMLNSILVVMHLQ